MENRVDGVATVLLRDLWIRSPLTRLRAHLERENSSGADSAVGKKWVVEVLPVQLNGLHINIFV